MGMNEVRAKKVTVEEVIERRLFTLEEELNRSLKKAVSGAVEEIRNIVAQNVSETTIGMQKAVCEEIEKQIEEMESEEVIVKGIVINRIDASTLENPHRSVVGEISLQLALI